MPFVLAAVAAPYAVVKDTNVAVRMRDGTVLRANVFRPGAPGRFAVLVTRTPYGKNDTGSFPSRAAAHGYAVVVQDVRGRYDSGGTWYPFVNEPNDGYDTVEWAAALPYSNGKVAMYGESYAGLAQWYAAVQRPPHLVAIAPFFAPTDYHEGVIYRGGEYEQLFTEGWATTLSHNQYTSAPWPDPIPSLALPLDRHSTLPYFIDWMAHPSYDLYWNRFRVDGYDRIEVPAFVVGGWFDPFLNASIRTFDATQQSAATPFARSQTRLTIIPGGHTGKGRQIGAINFGDDADVAYVGGRYEIDAEMLDWFDWILGGEAKADFSNPVRYFMMGENHWRTASSWPPKEARETTFYLHSNGALSPQRPVGERLDRYTYDPNDPVPTTGGALCCSQGPQPLRGSGPQDQRAVEKRSDVLVFSTPPLQRPLVIAGRVRVTLYGQSDGPDTDFTAKLVDVWPNGFAWNLCDGILRARYRTSTAIATPLRDNEIAEYDISVGDTAAVLWLGHRLRLEVSSSNWPRFARNLNIDGDQNGAATWRIAHNAVYHDRASPSSLTIDVLPQ